MSFVESTFFAAGKVTKVELRTGHFHFAGKYLESML
jgi:hypothetical protein